MKKLLLGVVASATLAATSALAADMAPVYKAPPPVVTVYNWSGFYTATGLGGAWWNIKGVDDLAPTLTHNTKAARFNYASVFGAQYQWGNVVIGVEGAYNKLYSNNYGTSLSPSADCWPGAGPGIACSSRVNNIWTVGGRLGYAWDRLMVFGTGGHANGHIYTQLSLTANGFVGNQSDGRHGGWFAGGGFEYYLTKFWMSDVILGAEYQHINLRAGRDASVFGPIQDTDMRATVDIVRARIVFKWTPAGTVVAKY